LIAVATSRSEGPGLGYNFNLPVPRKTADTGFLEVLQSLPHRARRSITFDRGTEFTG
jgi:IS30 family transposase